MVSYQDLLLSKNDEYFVALAKRGPHSFITLGVMNQGTPILLTSVGNFGDIDSDVKNCFYFTAKLLASHTLARMGQEPIRSLEGKIDIAYQAYDISYDQFKQFLGLIAEVEERQLLNPEIKAGIINTYKYRWVATLDREPEVEDIGISDLIAVKNDGQLTVYWIEDAKVVQRSFSETEVQSIVEQLPAIDKESDDLKLIENITSKFGCKPTDEDVLNAKAIRGYVPVEPDDNDTSANIIFEWNVLRESQSVITTKEKTDFGSLKKVIEDVQQIDVSNTCRTTALDIMEAILGFKTRISRFFFASLAFHTTLEAGEIKEDHFYRFPPPPPEQVEGKFTPEQLYTLKKLYKRMEEVPTLNPSSPKTWAKFNALKKMYNEIAGPNELSAEQLFVKIVEHEIKNKNALFDTRGFFASTSTTEEMFGEMKSKLESKKKPGNKR